MLIGSLGTLIARAMFSRSFKVSGWQPGPQKSREHEFPKKKRPLFLKFIGPVAPLWVLQPSQIMHMVATEPLLAIAVFASSIKVFGWQPGAPKFPGTRFSEKKKRLFLKFIGPVTPLWVLYPSEIMHLGSTDSLLARALF